MAEPANVICFYSYKGGTGRTMALANVGCALAAQHKESVLLVDWDLEAPGLHRFFEHLQEGSQWTGDSAQPRFPGLIDLFSDIWQRLADRPAVSEDDARAILGDIDLDRYISPTSVPGVNLLTAGSFDESYADRIHQMPWVELFSKAPSLFRVLAEVLGGRFRFVLIDSRTGLTDTAGICTMLMPQKLVVVFTPTRQSLTGVMDLVRKATAYRRESEDLRPLVVYPLASRIDATEEDLRQEWRFGNGTTVALGYQRQFEETFREAYDLLHCDLTVYFDEVQIQHVPQYAYGEELAVLVEQSSDRLSLGRSYRAFADVLAFSTTPWTAFRSKRMPQVYVGFSTRADADVVGVLQETLGEFDDRLSVVGWNTIEESGAITHQIIERIAGSTFGICYLSEPASVSGASRFVDNPNVLFEAGMLHALTNNPAGVPSGWIPIREEDSPSAPFDFAAERIHVVPRGPDGDLLVERFRARLRKQILNLLESPETRDTYQKRLPSQAGARP